MPARRADIHWVPMFKECDGSTSLPDLVARRCDRIMRTLKPSKAVAGAARDLLGTLGNFTLKDPTGFELQFDVDEKDVSSDRLGDDFTDLLMAVGQAALDAGRGVVFMFDEVQYISSGEWAPFIVALHRTSQKSLPITCVAVGLPSLPELTGDAKSHSERLFNFPRIGRLSRVDADAALAVPALEQQVTIEPAALAYAFEHTGGYPYFIQVLPWAEPRRGHARPQ